MIIRIIGEGQWTIDPADLPGLNELDDQIEAALSSEDQAALTEALTQLLEQVRAQGEAVPDEVLAESDLILPDSAVTLEQMRDFLTTQGQDDGLIPD